VLFPELRMISSGPLLSHADKAPEYNIYINHLNVELPEYPKLGKIGFIKSRPPALPSSVVGGNIPVRTPETCRWAGSRLGLIFLPTDFVGEA
jgi:hypothetical protein